MRTEYKLWWIAYFTSGNPVTVHCRNSEVLDPRIEMVVLGAMILLWPCIDKVRSQVCFCIETSIEIMGQ